MPLARSAWRFVSHSLIVAAFALPAGAAIMPAITDAKADEDLTVDFVVRMPPNTTLHDVTLAVSGLQVLPKIEYRELVGVSPRFLIDLGPPVANAEPELPDETIRWVRRLAKEGQSAKPQWRFQFISGDHSVCRLSRDLDASEVEKYLDRNELRKLTHADGTGLPFEREKLMDMARLFHQQTQTHTLVVLATEPPTWLSREITEWLTRSDEDEPARKAEGRDIQWRVRSGDAAALREISRWIAAGHLVPVMIARSASQNTAPEWLPLRHGTEELHFRAPSYKTPEELIASGLLRPMVERRGAMRVPLDQLQRSASGAHEVQLTVKDGRGTEYRSPKISVTEHAWRAWRPILIWIYIGVMAVATILLVSGAVRYHGKRGADDLDAAFSDLMAKTCWAYAAVTIAVCTTLVSNADGLSFGLSVAALGATIVSILIGVLFFRAENEQLFTAREMSRVSE
jgi:hypothetical protein